MVNAMRASQRPRATYPLATISAYGPDNTRATKLVVGILRHAGQKDVDPMRSWRTDAGDVRSDPLIAAEVADWLRTQRIKDTVSYTGSSVARTRRGSTIRWDASVRGVPSGPASIASRTSPWPRLSRRCLQTRC
jgi:hypothetical protein